MLNVFRQKEKKESWRFFYGTAAMFPARMGKHFRGKSVQISDFKKVGLWRAETLNFKMREREKMEEEGNGREKRNQTEHNQLFLASEPPKKRI